MKRNILFVLGARSLLSRVKTDIASIYPTKSPFLKDYRFLILSLKLYIISRFVIMRNYRATSDVMVINRNDVRVDNMNDVMVDNRRDIISSCY